MQKVTILLVDDLDGSEAVESINFGLDGDQYEIDLSADNARAMRDLLTGYAQKGRVTQKRRGRKPAALVEAQKAATTKPKGRGGSRSRTASIEDVEAAKAK